MKNYVNRVYARSVLHSNETTLKKNLAKPFKAVVLAALFLALGIGSALAQSRVTGTVRNSAGEPVIGVMVMVKGTQTGAISDVNGAYSINVPANATLVYSVLGQLSVEEVVGTRSVIDVTMQEDAQQIDQEVVTALGILRKEKTLTYSTQIVGGEGMPTSSAIIEP